MAPKTRKRKTNDVKQDDTISPKLLKSETTKDVTSKYFDKNNCSAINIDSKKKNISKKKTKDEQLSIDIVQVDQDKSVDATKVSPCPDASSKVSSYPYASSSESLDVAGESADHKKNSPDEKGSFSQRLDFSFYDQSCEDLAKALLGQTVVTMFEGNRLAGKIVETEAYLGAVDKAAHSYKGKTERNAAMFMKPGTSYVYNIYGMYCCLNISAQGDGNAVLIRSLQPIEGLEIMDKLRTKGKEGASLLKKEGKDLCNGPSKLCQALCIKKDNMNKLDLCTSDVIWLEKGEIIDNDGIVICKRINIDYAEEWKDKPLRFYVKGNNFVSVRDKNVDKS